MIHSSLRLAYEEVQDFFDEKPFPRASELEALRPSLIGLRDLARRLNRMRMERGALDLDMPEAMVVMGPEGEVKDVRERERLESHRLVEECMLAANEAMARLMAERHLPGLYRIHEEPDPKSLERLAVKLHPFSVRLPAREIKPEDLQAAIARVAKMEGGSILMRIILRSLKKARYSERNQGHHGLASACYCHFTSPIRRYPDLIVHRVIKEWLAAGRLSPERQADWEDAAPQLAEHTSMREVRADDIERMAMDIMSLKFLQPNVGEVVDGMISDLAPIGFFVRLDPWPIEGLVHVRSLEDDRYDFDEDIYALRGQRTGRLFRPTQKVRVFIEKVDPLGRRLDLKLVDARPAKAGSAPSGKAGGAARRAEKRGRKSKDAKGKKGRKRK
ncbi:MAG: Ribonuclease R [candidate division BRC1 bacterium ADurb.BinA364]|nr:MAG: Ribonuclease R [candidate division BRC1 bacterium ADurb.BinA364]